MPQIFTLIASGSNVSDTIDLTKQKLAAVQIPVVNSAMLAFQGGFSTTSALFTRIANASGEIRYSVQAGSLSIAGPLEAVPFGYLRLETVMSPGSAQTNPRTLTLMTIPR